MEVRSSSQHRVSRSISVVYISSPVPCSNLDERTREVYRENVKMAEALSLHMESEEALRRAKDSLEMSNRQLVAEKELNQELVKDKIAQARHQKRTIKDLQVEWGFVAA